MSRMISPLLAALVALVATAGLLTGCMEPVDASHPEVRKLNDANRELRNQLTSLEDQMEVLTMEVAGLADRLDAYQSNGAPVAGGAPAREYENQINALNKGLLDLREELASMQTAVESNRTVAQQAAEAASRAPAQQPSTPAQTARTESASAAGGASTPPVVAVTPAPARTTTTPAPARTQERPQPQGSYYLFQDGDTVESVARANGLTAERLREVNNIPAGRNPIAGARIWVPAQ